MKIRVLLILFAAVHGSLVLAQDKKILKQLNDAMALHNKAQTFEEELEAAKAFQKISDSNPDKWLPAYWTSFTYSQAGRISQEKLKYYSMAFEYLEKIDVDKMEDLQQVYVKALDALISGLAQGPYFMSGNSEKGMEMVKRQQAALSAGLTIDSKSPLLYVLMGTNSLGEYQRSKDITKKIIGKLFLEKAQEIYDASGESNHLEPSNWNKGWIEVWLNRIENM